MLRCIQSIFNFKHGLLVRVPNLLHKCHARKKICAECFKDVSQPKVERLEFLMSRRGLFLV